MKITVKAVDYAVSEEKISLGDTAVQIHTGTVKKCANELDEFIMNNDLSGPANMGKVWFKVVD